MDDLLATLPLISLPNISQSINDLQGGAVHLRGFGVLESDLNVNFSMGNQAALATELLESCTIDPQGQLPEEFYLDLSIGTRTLYLLLLATAAERKTLGFPLACSGCGQEIELELTLEELSQMQTEADCSATVSVEIGGKHQEFRKPTGRDQKAWSSLSFSSEKKAVVAMLDRLAPLAQAFETLSREEITIVERSLSEADPLVDFHCSVRCSECDELKEYNIDLLATALTMLLRAQQQLLVTVHRLASHYHWTEQEIFAVPDRRRRKYLQLIGPQRK